MQNKEKIRASFYVAPQNAKVTAIAPDKVLMKAEKALNFWLKVRIERGYPLTAYVLRQKSLSLYENFQKKDGTEEETKPSAANRRWL